MDDFDNLNSKTDSDLRQIAVAFGDFTPEEAESKTRDELIMAITGAKNIGDVTVVDLAEDPIPVKPVSIPEPMRSNENTKSLDELIEDVGRTARFETNELADAMKKAEREEEIKVEENQQAVEEKIETAAAPEAEVKAKEEKKPAKRTRKTKAKAEEAAPEAKASEEKTEEAAPAKAEKAAKEDGKSSKKTETKAKRTRGGKKKEAKAEESEPAEPTPIESLALEEKASEEVKAEETKPEESKAEEPKAEGAKPAEPVQNQGKHGRSKRRKISFGPGQDTKTVETTEQVPAEGTEEENQEPALPVEIEIEGVLAINNNEGNKNDFCGFIHRHNYLPGEDDAYVPGQFIKRMGLRRGDYIKGFAMPKRGKDRYAPLKRITEVNGIPVIEGDYDNIRRRPKFESLTAIYPNERLDLETEKEDISTRIIDLFSPIGKGQRGMIVSPPKAGKTILLQKVANSITANNPNCVLIVLLIDERPEEVTDMQRNIQGEVVYSTFDKRPENHVRVTELVLERAMRLVELGKDVVILLDSMTRLARAYNLTINPTGRTLSGGLDPGSLYGPKRFFGAARNIEHGGSLTILATALIETGSRMDEVIFEEFKGTGNMEVTLDRKLADRRVFPAIAVDKSGTRREDLLLTQEELDAVWLIRRRIAEADTITATNAVISFMEKTTSNKSFVLSVKKSFATD
ncbi:transcription termination factor Rho [Butyrivibrio sp. AE2032]|uniref:transcription termination factor Rho n=1 Tax=Butyrivibrio sp. AE2032 TaxID=1458463 RepID=UPI000557AF23|nr:transcription termination factor Rho [Butyrivibrio sp. AE2032]